MQTPDLTIYQNTEERIIVEVNNEDGVDKNLANSTIVFCMGSVRARTTAFSKAGAVLNTGTDGLIYVDLVETETLALTPGFYDCQFQVTDSDDKMQVVKELIVLIKYTLTA